MTKNSVYENYHSIAEYIELGVDGKAFYHSGYAWGFLNEEEYDWFYGWNLADGDWEDVPRYKFPIQVAVDPFYFHRFINKAGVEFVKYICNFLIEDSKYPDEKKYYKFSLCRNGKGIQIDVRYRNCNYYEGGAVVLSKEKPPLPHKKAIFRTTIIVGDGMAIELNEE